MKKTSIIILILILSIPSIMVFAGTKNNNDDHGNSADATGKENFKDGCRPPAHAASVWVFIPPEGVIWLGAKCCASNVELITDLVYFPNQCCNPPDFVPPFGVPGNHCLCFDNRDYQELHL